MGRGKLVCNFFYYEDSKESQYVKYLGIYIYRDDEDYRSPYKNNLDDFDVKDFTCLSFFCC